MKFGLKFQIANLKNIEFILTDRKLKIKKLSYVTCYLVVVSIPQNSKFSLQHVK